MIKLPVHTLVSCIRLWSTFYRKCGMSNSFNRRGERRRTVLQSRRPSTATQPKQDIMSVEDDIWIMEGKVRTIIRDLKILQRELRVSGGSEGSGGSCPGSLDGFGQVPHLTQTLTI